MSFYTERLVRKATKQLEADGVIQLDLFAKLMEAGIDVTELERKVRNG